MFYSPETSTSDALPGALGTLGAAPSGSTSTPSVKGSTAYDSIFNAATEKYGLPPGLLKAVAHTESTFNPNAVSPKGAAGLMQFMPDTAKRFGIDPHDPTQAVDGAARYIAVLGKRYGGDLTKVVRRTTPARGRRRGRRGTTLGRGPGIW